MPSPARAASGQGIVDASPISGGTFATGPPWETYLTDPGERPNPQTWQTEILQPIK